MILTVGPSFKYLPIDGLDFLEIWEEIIKAVPEAVVLAVGFDGDQRWKDASVRVGNRIRTLGAMPHSQLLKVQDAADLYVEALPFGTTTSLLEAGLKGIPVGLAPPKLRLHSEPMELHWTTSCSAQPPLQNIRPG